MTLTDSDTDRQADSPDPLVKIFREETRAPNQHVKATTRITTEAPSTCGPEPRDVIDARVIESLMASIHRYDMKQWEALQGKPSTPPIVSAPVESRNSSMGRPCVELPANQVFNTAYCFSPAKSTNTSMGLPYLHEQELRWNYRHRYSRGPYLRELG